jgi:hypothetical protein
MCQDIALEHADYLAHTAPPSAPYHPAYVLNRMGTKRSSSMRAACRSSPPPLRSTNSVSKPPEATSTPSQMLPGLRSVGPSPAGAVDLDLRDSLDPGVPVAARLSIAARNQSVG